MAPPPLPPPPPPPAPVQGSKQPPQPVLDAAAAKAKPIPPLIKPVYKPPPVLPKGDGSGTWPPPPVPHKVPPNLKGSVPHKVSPVPPKAEAEVEVVNLDNPKAAAPEPSQPSQPASEPSQLSQPAQQKARPKPQPKPKGPPECVREQWVEYQQQQAAQAAAPRLLPGRPRGEATYHLSTSRLASFGRVLCVHRFSQRVRFRKRWQIPCRRPKNGRCTT